MSTKSNSVAVKAQSPLQSNSKKKNSSASPNYLGDGTSKAIAPSGADWSNYYMNPATGVYDPRFYGYRNQAFSLPTGHGFNAPMRYGDDYWNIGSALGALWGANYNKRGAEKSAAEADRLMQEYQQAFGQGEKPKDQPQQAMPYEDGDLYRQMKQAQDKGEVAPTTEMPDYSKAPEGMYKQFEASGFKGYTPEVDHKSETRQYLMNKYYPDGAAHDNPDGDKRDGNKIGQAVTSDLSKIDVTKMPQGGYDGEALKNSIIAKLRAQGRNDWQIAQAMQTIAPQIAQGQKDYNDNAFNTLYQQFGQLIKNNDADSYDKASMLYSNMVKLKPEYSKALGLQYDRAYGKYSDQQKQADMIAKIKEAYPDASDADVKKYVADGGKLGQLLNTNWGLSNPYASVGKAGKGTGTTKNSNILASNEDGSITWTKGDQAELQFYLKLDEDGKLTKAADKNYLAYLKQKRDAARGFTLPKTPKSPEEGETVDVTTKLMNDWNGVEKRYYDIIDNPNKYGEDYNSIANSYEGVGKYGSELARMLRDYGNQLANEREENIENSGTNRGAALQSAKNAGLYVNPWTGEVAPADPYSAPTEEQLANYREWKQRYSQFA